MEFTEYITANQICTLFLHSLFAQSNPSQVIQQRLSTLTLFRLNNIITTEFKMTYLYKSHNALKVILNLTQIYSTALTFYSESIKRFILKIGNFGNGMVAYNHTGFLWISKWWFTNIKWLVTNIKHIMPCRMSVVGFFCCEILMDQLKYSRVCWHRQMQQLLSPWITRSVWSS